MEQGCPEAERIVILVGSAHAAYPFEIFYSWTNFDSLDPATRHFTTYRAAAISANYEPYTTLDIPIGFQEHQSLFKRGISFVVEPVRMGLLGQYYLVIHLILT